MSRRVSWRFPRRCLDGEPTTPTRRRDGWTGGSAAAIAKYTRRACRPPYRRRMTRWLIPAWDSILMERSEDVRSRQERYDLLRPTPPQSRLCDAAGLRHRLLLPGTCPVWQRVARLTIEL